MDHSNAVVASDALVLGWLLLTAVPVLAVLALVGTRRRLAAVTAVVAGFGLQTFHTFEHLVQVRFWSDNPWSAPFMSPLAKKAASGLESIATSVFSLPTRPTLGMELLHLVGNTLFLLGIFALLVGKPFSSRRQPALFAFIFEGLHLLEHMVLTSFVIAGRPAWGSSTLFNALSGAQLSTHRIWWHLVMNVAALALFTYALVRPVLAGRMRLLAIGLLAVSNFAPVLVAHFYASPMSGYGSTAQLLDPSTVISLLINPVTLTAAALLIIPASRRS
jgi:hypothetical protein